ncbi:MAG: cytochrome c family protein [Thiotrichales bacterium]|nr:cytochrome c family protein [Thiotrichales bacterium]
MQTIPRLLTPGIILVGLLAALTPATAGAASDETAISERLASASPERGRKVFRVCTACHAVEAGAPHGIGPTLWAVIGREVASAEGFDRYTPAMKSFGGAWSPERLDQYLRQPMAAVEGTTMVFPGLASADDRADVIAWLNANSPQPIDFTSNRAATGGAAGTGDNGGIVSAASQPERPPVLGVLVAAEGAEETYAYCAVCHSERIVAQQGLTRPDWEELLEQMVEENGMNPIGEPDLGRVLDYLTANYGPDRPNFPDR